VTAPGKFRYGYYAQHLLEI